MNEITEYKHKRASHPGEYVREIIDDMGVTQEEFANRMGVSGKCVSEILNGKCRITPELAGKLSAMTGMGAEVWMNLQAIYDRRILEIKADIALDRQAEILSMLDFGYFVRMTGGTPVKGTKEKISFLCKLLGIFSLEILKKGLSGCNFRASKSKRNSSNNICARAWLYFAWKKAAETAIEAPFSASLLESRIEEIRGLSRQGVNKALPRLGEILAECGVVFIALPHLRNAKVNGVVKWFSNNKKVLLAINDNMKTEDSFWFTLFHEIKHILQRKYRATFVSLDTPEQDPEMENEADAFAQETLLPAAIYNQFVLNGDFSCGNIQKLSASEGIHPGIVAARLARDHHVKYTEISTLRSIFSLPSASD